MNHLSAAIKNKSAIIMDVFDVLALRPLHDSKDVFSYLEQGLGSMGFCEARIAAEQSILNSDSRAKREYVPLDKIYGEMYQNYQFIKENEISLVLGCAKINPEIKDIFDEAIESNIPIYLYGNTNLPQDCMVDFLSRNNCGGFKKYYSAFSSGAEECMYLDILREVLAAPNDIIHISSNLDDCEALRLGIDVLPYEPVFRRFGLDRNSAFYAVLNEYKSKDIAIPILENNIANYLVQGHDKDYWTCFGYKYIGIIAFEFMNYIGSIARNLQIKKVFFSKNNGYCLKAAFDLMYPEIQSEIILSSERELKLSSIRDEQSLVDLLVDKAKTGISYEEWFKWLDPTNECGLHIKFRELFPGQEQTIATRRNFEKIERFVVENQDCLLSRMNIERENLNHYLEEIGVFSESAAIVDVSREMVLLHGIKSAHQKLHTKHSPTGFWWECDQKISWKTGVLSQLNVKSGHGVNGTNTFGYLYRILSLALSEPQNSGGIAGGGRKNLLGEFVGEANPQGRDSAVVDRIYSGTMDCLRAFCEYGKSLPIPSRQEGAMAVCEYLEENIDRRDMMQLQQISPADNPCGGLRKAPIFRQEQPVIGIVNPWPEDVSAEAEVITRLLRTAKENQIGCVLLDNFGHILNDRQKATSEYVDENALSFVITTHYECPKIRDVFYYNPLWNPPEIPLRLEDYTPRATNLFLMNDDYLIYDQGGMSNHLRAVLMNAPRTLEGASALTASFPASAALRPKLDKPIMFYCGMNWEVMFAGPGRHEGLFKLLDDTNKVRFYGPERVDAWGGLKPWEGYRCYKGMIPFDGFSILEKINECGICLVLSSDIHRRAGAATNRLYEACAAGAVIISDDNDFVLQHFQDAALFITYNKNDPVDTFNQIMEKYDWIIEHPADALKLANRAQEIFLKGYSLDEQLRQIISNHPARLRQVSKDLYAQNEDKKVLVTYVLNTQNMGDATVWLDRVYKNLHGQIYQNIELAIAADRTLAEEINNYCSLHCACAHVVEMKLFDKKGIRMLTDGEAIREMQKTIPHEYYINTTADEVWFYDHITSLVRAAGDGEIGSYSGSCFEDVDGYRRVNFFDVLNSGYLLNGSKINHPLTPGQFLFKADADDLLPEYLFGTLDGKEHIAYAGLLSYRYKKTLAFNRRMSLCYSDIANDKRGCVLDTAMQYHFIMDLLRFYLPEQQEVAQSMMTQGGTEDSKRRFVDYLLLVPLKLYLQLRYYRFQLRRKRPGSAKYKKYSQKYDACVEKYRQYWNV